ncbi:phosphotransferase enzyme family protein [Burkholderia plantarii]|uniref:phosphotransferase enzyme family protein n=1 Tax=Burkholderia plantarii TaxID=41899 RepID=UPI0018DEAEA4|nr:phosphotransferase [Burkholderia plantarii]MBI0331132.1 phosphotransferase [Burkholderia plantarii]
MDPARLSDLYDRRFHRADLVQDGINKTYRIDEDGEPPRYLRLYRQFGRSHEEIDFELRLLQALPDMNGVAVAKPIPKVDGSLLSELIEENESRVACLFDAAEGRVPESTIQDMKRLGQALATLHNATRQIHLPFSRPMNASAIFLDSITSLRQTGSRGAVIAQQIESECRDLPATLDRLVLPLGPCHGDVWAGNVRLLGERVTFFDFDECGFGPYVMDLATPTSPRP